MEFDPRSEFMALSNRVAEGEVIHDKDLLDDVHEADGDDPRQRFIRDSQLIAEGKSLADIRQIHEDERPQASLDHRERFIRDSQRLAAGESLQTVAKGAKGAKASRQIRNDAQRFNAGGKLNFKTLAMIEDEDDEEVDHRQMLLDRMARMADG